jgi:hypothetical protein
VEYYALLRAGNQPHEPPSKANEASFSAAELLSYVMDGDERRLPYTEVGA